MGLFYTLLLDVAVAIAVADNEIFRLLGGLGTIPFHPHVRIVPAHGIQSGATPSSWGDLVKIPLGRLFLGSILGRGFWRPFGGQNRVQHQTFPGSFFCYFIDPFQGPKLPRRNQDTRSQDGLQKRPQIAIIADSTD